MIKELEEIYAVSGAERELRNFLKDRLVKVCDRIWCDSMGNLHAEKGQNDKKPVLACHMDEPGIIVTQITSDGYLKFETVGRLKAEFLVSKRVIINGIAGIISLKAVHLTTKEERETPVKLSQLFIDIGADSAERAAELIMPGDYGALCTEYAEMGNCIKGRALAGRVGCDIAIKLFMNPKIENLHLIFAVQREIGCRGMITAAYGLEADYAIITDGVDAESPGIENKAVCGGGAAVLLRTGDLAADAELTKKAVSIADKNDILIQKCCSDKISQANIISKNGGNIHCLTVGLPIKYAEGTVQAASKADIEAMYRLVEELFIRGNKNG